MNHPTAQSDLNFLTASIIDAQHKPHLEPTLRASLESMGHDKDAITEALNGFYAERTLQ